MILLDEKRSTVRLTQTAFHLDQAEALEEALCSLAGPSLHVDLDDIEYLNANGLSTLLAVHKRVRDAGGQLVLLNVRPEILWVLNITRLDTVFDIEPRRRVQGLLAYSGISDGPASQPLQMR